MSLYLLLNVSPSPKCPSSNILCTPPKILLIHRLTWILEGVLGIFWGVLTILGLGEVDFSITRSALATTHSLGTSWLENEDCTGLLQGYVRPGDSRAINGYVGPGGSRAIDLWNLSLEFSEENIWTYCLQRISES